jgi:hypothetical protein
MRGETGSLCHLTLGKTSEIIRDNRKLNKGEIKSEISIGNEKQHNMVSEVAKLIFFLWYFETYEPLDKILCKREGLDAKFLSYRSPNMDIYSLS